MTQTSLWQHQQQSSVYAELCNALYERELTQLASSECATVAQLQARLNSLTFYIKRTAHLMAQTQSPLTLDIQNASWSTKQSTALPLTGQSLQTVWQWYQHFDVPLGLVVPVLLDGQIRLDSIDRVDKVQQRFRTNFFGWFAGVDPEAIVAAKGQLLKPTKKVMMSACAGHCWQRDRLMRPKPLSLRELLLSCAIDWRNFKQPLAI